ncbi:MAG: DUF4191 domain-containing protein [Bifidobacteriaceae bacterium]|jgi:hypothetical protein|nr:DUF4191 domain-containing protein [Bifidobacteriaceae bacterium]
MAKNNNTKPVKPKKPMFQGIKNTFKIFGEAFKLDPKIPWIIFPIFLIIFGGGIAIGISTGKTFFWSLISFPLALLVMVMVFSRLVDKAGFKAIDGQLGASSAILRTIKAGGIIFDEEPVAFDRNNNVLVFRGTGRAGIFLVSEGRFGPAQNALAQESKKIRRILKDTPVHLIQMGTGEKQVPLKKLKWTIVKMKPELTKDELATLNKKLKAIGGYKLPVPKGIDVNKMVKMNKRAMRGK